MCKKRDTAFWQAPLDSLSSLGIPNDRLCWIGSLWLLSVNVNTLCLRVDGEGEDMNSSSACSDPWRPKRPSATAGRATMLTPSLPQPVKCPGWKVHTYTHANSISDGLVTNLLSILCISIEIHSSAHTNGAKKPLMVSNLALFWSFFEWRRGKPGSEKVKDVGTPPVKSNLCTSLILVSTAVRRKVTKTTSEEQLSRNNQSEGLSDSLCQRRSTSFLLISPLGSLEGPAPLLCSWSLLGSFEGPEAPSLCS